MAVTIIRLVYTPSQTFSPDFAWTDMEMVIILVVESNLTIMNAAYPSVRSFLNKVSTGFLVAETAKDTSKSGSKGKSYALHSFGGSRSAGRRAPDPALVVDDKVFMHHSTAVKGDMKSDRSFGSEVIMVRRSVEIDERSLADS